MMRKSGFFKVIAVVAVMIFSFALTAAEAKQPQKAAAVQTQEESCTGAAKNFCNMGRGLVNVVTCWMEVPRCLVYHNSQLPVLGLVVGSIQGAGFTAIRAFAGVADVLSFGFMTDSVYDCCHGFEDYVWDARWVPRH